MATAALMNPSNPYQPYHGSSYSNNYHAPPPPPQTSNIHGMISPTDSRRTSDEADIPHRQSLPSIQEVIQGAKGPSQYHQSAPPPTGPPAPSLPSPFSSSASSRPYGDGASDPNPSPRTLHPSGGFPRPEAAPSYSDPARHSVSSRPIPPPLNTFPAQHPSPQRMGSTELDQRHQEAPNSGYPHPSSGQQGLYPQTGRLPPGQLPLSGYDMSPRQGGHPLPSPYDGQRPPMYEDTEYTHRPSEYKVTLDRAFEAWTYSEALNDVGLFLDLRTSYAPPGVLSNQA